jgi:hypothetical protein
MPRIEIFKCGHQRFLTNEGYGLKWYVADFYYWACGRKCAERMRNENPNGS